jgi:hypothetical protein
VIYQSKIRYKHYSCTNQFKFGNGIILIVQSQRRYSILDNKLKIFALTSVIVSSLIIPLIIPHVSHQFMIYHIIIHIISLNIAVFLGLVSIFAYLKNSNIRMFLMALGFVSLAIVEGIMLLSSTGNLDNVILPSVNIELPHIVLLVMLTLFGLGLLKAN